MLQKDILNCIKNKKLFLIAGPCVIESEKHATKMAKEIKKITDKLGIYFIFKASYDKANRSSIQSFRGLGIKKGLKILGKIKKELNIPILTDVHEVSQVKEVSKVADILQIPAFLCRQTDLLVTCAKSKKVVNIKKGQFLSPQETKNIVEKMKQNKSVLTMLTERGTSFGYNNLIVDMRSFPIMKAYGAPIIYDATHSLQLPGGSGQTTGGLREFIPNLARSAVANGIDGLFIEVHDNPEKALSDSATQFPLSKLESLLRDLIAINNLVKQNMI